LLRAACFLFLQSVDSAGTSSEHEGDCPDARSISVASKNGIDISGHKAQQLTASHWREFDIILAMDESNFRNAQRVKPKEGAKAKLLMYLPEGRVEDPWYHGPPAFTECYNVLTKHTQHVFDSIAAAHGKAAAL
jgi:protein-tyrosine phosphatase